MRKYVSFAEMNMILTKAQLLSFVYFKYALFIFEILYCLVKNFTKDTMKTYFCYRHTLFYVMQNHFTEITDKIFRIFF